MGAGRGGAGISLKRVKSQESRVRSHERRNSKGGWGRGEGWEIGLGGYAHWIFGGEMGWDGLADG